MKKSKKFLVSVLCIITLLTASIFAFGNVLHKNVSEYGYTNDEIEALIDNNNDDDIAYCVLLKEVIVTPNK